MEKSDTANEFPRADEARLGDPLVENDSRLCKIRDEAAALSDDLRRVAHQLHPATLDSLGLMAKHAGNATVEVTLTGTSDGFELSIRATEKDSTRRPAARRKG